MTRFGYHASHEQHAPARLLEYARAAESAGFDGAMCSDHLHPWTPEQGECGFAWSWLGAALQATGLSFGTVSAPGWRYHPAVLAQAIATLGSMYPGRLWVALGSGEAVNESVTGEPWPARDERTARLAESASVIRRLLAGEEVTHRGRIVVEQAKLYSRPAKAPMLLGAALGPDTAERVGAWADGLMTVGAEPDALRELVDAFRRGGGAGKPVHVQHALCWAPTEKEARRHAREQWAFSALGREVLPILRTPAQFAAASKFVTEDDVAKGVRVSSSTERHVEWLSAYAELGVDAVYLFNVGKNQAQFIDEFGARVLPQLPRLPRGERARVTVAR